MSINAYMSIFEIYYEYFLTKISILEREEWYNNINNLKPIIENIKSANGI